MELRSLAKKLMEVSCCSEGRQIHARLVISGFSKACYIYLNNLVVSMYTKFNALYDASQVFQRMGEYKDEVSWNCIIGAFSKSNSSHKIQALQLYKRMLNEGFANKAGRITYTSLLGACGMESQGRQIHAHVMITGHEVNSHVSTALLRMYSRFQSLDCARKVFIRATREENGADAVLWNNMIDACVENDHDSDAFFLLQEMHRQEQVRPDEFTYSVVLKACALEQSVYYGKVLHGLIFKLGYISGIFMGNGLVDMYAKSGFHEDACQVFDEMPLQNSVTWNAMLSGFCKSGKLLDAWRVFEEMPEKQLISWNSVISGLVNAGENAKTLEMFLSMRKQGMEPDHFTLASVIAACECSQHGIQLHGHVEKRGFMSNSFVRNSLIDMYGKNELVADACKAFEEGENKNDRVMWNSLMSGYIDNGLVEEAIELFFQMLRFGIMPDEFSFTSVLCGCTEISELRLGVQIHAYVIKRGSDIDEFVGAGLIDFYSKCRSIGNAIKVYDNISNKNISVHNSMLAGYVCNSHLEKSLELFKRLQLAGISVDQFMLSSVLSVCASLAALQQGKRLHAYSIKTGLESHLSVRNSLITMYAKSGTIGDATIVFGSMSVKNVVSWTAMVAAYALHGHAKEALEVFEEIEKAGVKPDGVSFVSILSACSHEGLVDEGQECFDSMITRHSIVPNTEHYSCMIDLLARAGSLADAMKFVRQIPMENDAVTWGALLNAAKLHKNMDLAQLAEEKMKLDLR